VILDSTIAHNGVDFAGGGISNGGSLTILNSTIANNQTGSIGFAGGIFNGGSLTILNSTIAANRSFGSAGGIFGTGSLTNCTIADNFGIGGGLNGSFVLLNTILARNRGPGGGGGPDCLGTVISLGTNLIGDPTNCTITLQPTDLTGDPGLGAFTDNGRPGNGHIPLLKTSQARDAGIKAACPRTDQLGRLRLGACDIGAIEFRRRDNRPHDEEKHHDQDLAATAD